MISKEEKWLMQALSAALRGTDTETESMEKVEVNWNRVLTLSQTHAVVPFLYSLVECGGIHSNIVPSIQNTCIQTVQQSYRLMFLTHYVVTQLEAAGIPVVVLKGVSAAALYSVPELRKSGDVDLFLPQAEETLERAAKVMDEAGFLREVEQRVNHHHVWRTPQGIEIELHVMLAEPFDDEGVNRILADISQNVSQHMERKEIMGLSFPVLAEAYQAYQLLLHMLQHFLRSGFGLKLLCDWVVFWNRNISKEEIRQYKHLIRESGLEGFSDMVTWICMNHLGLYESKGKQIISPKNMSERYDSFLEDILEAAEFGQNDEARMVVLRGTGLKDYVREFHHQMKLTYPTEGKKIILWPILWTKLFLQFCRNNKQIRNVSTRQVLKKARERSRNMANLRLFQKNGKKS
nr:nucleotidyltransferase family protein [Eubacterium sp.]